MIKASEIVEIHGVKQYMLYIFCIIFGTERNLLDKIKDNTGKDKKTMM